MFVWKSTFETMRKAWQHSQGEILDRDIKIRELTKALDEIKFHNFAIAKLLGKLNPMYGVDESSPARKAESDAIGERVIAQLRGEFAAIRNQEPTQ